VIDRDRLLERIETLGAIGRDPEGRLSRIAATDADKAGRDQLVRWLTDAGLEIIVDRIGNIFGAWRPDRCRHAAPLMLGSHIDTVVDAGQLDGAYGVLAALEVIEALKAGGAPVSRPVMVGAFTNEEGARFSPDMMGSLVYAGGLSPDAALGSRDRDGVTLGADLARIGYAGTAEPGFARPHAFVELHIEQGPVLEREGAAIGVVENLQGISWRRITISGMANHAGTTPMSMRSDAGLAAALVTTFVHQQAKAIGPRSVATVGALKLEPNVINVIPSRATLTVDLRDPDEAKLRRAEAGLAAMLARTAGEHGLRIETERLARFEPVAFDPDLCNLIETLATERGLTTRRMTSGAGHDAQMMARLCPTAMIFVPSRDGISHNPREHTDPGELAAGAQLLLDVAASLIGA
jgi:N-carbamoyl-L-amino-acid hydrolase